VLFILFFCFFFTFMLAFRLLTDFLFHGPNFGMSFIHMFSFTGTGTFLFFLFGCSRENVRLWKFACGCYKEAALENDIDETHLKPNEESIKKTRAFEGSVSWVIRNDEERITETAEYEMNTRPTQITATNFTPVAVSNEIDPDSPLRPKNFQNSSRIRESFTFTSHPRQNQTPSRKSKSKSNTPENNRKGLPPPPQLQINEPLLNMANDEIVASTGSQQEGEEKEVELDDETDYIQLG